MLSVTSEKVAENIHSIKSPGLILTKRSLKYINCRIVPGGSALISIP